MSKNAYPLLALALVLISAPCPVKALQCANAQQWPRWVWHDLEWVDGTSFDNDIYDATYEWEVQNGNTIYFWPSSQWEDLIFDYANLPAGIVATTVPHTQLENTACANKTDYCGLCMNGATFYYAELQFDGVQLSDQYQIYMAEGYVQTYDQVMTQAMSHELGHAMREADLGLAFSQIQNCTATSIMGSLDVNLRCQNYLAQQCDGNTFASAYVSWLFDSPVCEGNPYCSLGSGSGGMSC
jgi:hypothetical protein